MSSIICPQCNNQIDDGFDFCPFCGQKVFKAQKNEDETRLIATGSVVWYLEMNKKFQNIHWVASGQKKKYVIAQIISLLFFIYPGLIYALTFWITRSLLIKKIYKNDLANNGGGNGAAMIKLLGYLTDENIPYTSYNYLSD